MILVSKSDICILIAENGKKLIIEKDDHRFTLLKDKYGVYVMKKLSKEKM